MNLQQTVIDFFTAAIEADMRLIKLNFYKELLAPGIATAAERAVNGVAKAEAVTAVETTYTNLRSTMPTAMILLPYAPVLVAGALAQPAGDVAAICAAMQQEVATQKATGTNVYYLADYAPVIGGAIGAAINALKEWSTQ
ncbi:MAG: hypothetical protein EBZ77_17845 [Chitinophagia bacterium]|nr:hypothetical protein [Chitinophagia bacterium]